MMTKPNSSCDNDIDIDDHFQDECGVFGLFNCKDAAKLCYLGLYALQHRGQESAGIVSLENKKHFYVVKAEGLVSEVFNSENLQHLRGDFAIGHVRYSTTGGNNINNIQPMYSQMSHGKVAIAHNGNLTNAFNIYKELEKIGALFQSSVDSEIILHLLSRSPGDTPLARFKHTLSQIEGAYSIVALGEKYLLAARDPNGFRPLVLGKLGQGYVVSSETCALDLIGAEYIREIEPGEMVYIDKNGITSLFLDKKVTPSMCIFEHVYFARPDSIVFGETSHGVRKEFGRQLAREYPIEGDLVMAIPDSGNSAALGYAEESGIPYELGMTRNHYIGRTFIQPDQKIRDFGVKIKLNPIREVIEGKRVIVVDDSLVRGTTSRQRVSAIRDAGAKEVHLRISSPPILFPCHFGIDTPKRSKLIAAKKNIQEIMEYVGADSLGYLTQEGMLMAIKAHSSKNFCTACFDGKYPIKVQNKGKDTFEGSRKIKLYAQK